MNTDATQPLYPGRTIKLVKGSNKILDILEKDYPAECASGIYFIKDEATANTIRYVCRQYNIPCTMNYNEIYQYNDLFSEIKSNTKLINKTYDENISYWNSLHGIEGDG